MNYKVLITTSSYIRTLSELEQCTSASSIVVEFDDWVRADEAVINATENSNDELGVRVNAVRLN